MVIRVDAEGLLTGLTDTQRAAVVTAASPLCIQASAGAGKTRVLTRRIAYRVATGTADANHVLALTFTRKAAGGLTDRLRQLGVRDRVAAGTFHGLAYAQLRQYWRDRGEPAPALLDRKARLLAGLARGRPQAADVAVADLASEIEWAQARLISPEHYEAAVAAVGRRPPIPPDALAALYDRYLSEKRRRRLADFDDLLAGCARALETDPAFAAAQRWRWRHVFVDEFQDVNPLQHRLLEAWLGSRLDLCVVGDPNQAIYAWNGADPHLLRSFPQRWPGAEVIRLDANHRCTPQVVAAAAAVLGAEGAGLCSTRPDGPEPSVRAYADDRAEAHGVAAELRRTHAEGLRWSQLAVLVRTNAQAVALVEALRAAQVPYRVAAGDGILDHRAVRGVLAEWRGRPGRPLASVVTDLQGLTAGSSDAADDVVEDPETDRERRGALNGLADLARTYERMDPAATTEGFLSWLQAGSGAEDPDRSAEAVTVCSFHRAKGLEWPAVWVIGLERGLVPIGHATTPDAIAEERRLLYVALTRAERDLHCSWAERRKFGGRSVPREPSPWLEAMARAGRGSGSASPELGAEGDGWRQHLAVDRQRLRDLRRRPTQLPDGAADVLEALCAWRAGTARAAAVPPHVLLHDVTLAALAAARPATMEDLVAVPGIGKVKATRYGAALLAVVGEHRASA